MRAQHGRPSRQHTSTAEQRPQRGDVQHLADANKPTLQQQFACHAIVNNPTIGQTWDLESWRRVISNPLEMFPNLCNW